MVDGKFTLNVSQAPPFTVQASSVGFTTVTENVTSNNQDMLIRNGITGEKYAIKKGTKFESELFKVMDTTGRVDEDGFLLNKKKNNPTTNTIYYNSPEEYQRFIGKKLPDFVITNWRKRNGSLKDDTT